MHPRLREGMRVISIILRPTGPEMVNQMLTRLSSETIQVFIRASHALDWGAHQLGKKRAVARSAHHQRWRPGHVLHNVATNAIGPYSLIPANVQNPRCVRRDPKLKAHGLDWPRVESVNRRWRFPSSNDGLSDVICILTAFVPSSDSLLASAGKRKPMDGQSQFVSKSVR